MRKGSQDKQGQGISPMVYGKKVDGTDEFIGSRAPQRVTITLNYAAYKGLERRSTIEGRSMSNLAAFILEKALNLNS